VTTAFLGDERFTDLLLQHVTSGLDEAESAELERCLERYPGVDRRAFESTAAALTLAARLPADPLPVPVRARLLAQSGAGADAAPVADLAAVRQARAGAISPSSPVRDRGRAAAWWATAAAVLLAIAGWYPRLAGPPHAPDPAELRARWLAANPGLVPWEFSPTADPGAAGASGDVVFDPSTQRGYMHFIRLRANDRKQYQYQLWIFDAGRDDRYPVDGGVFDVPVGAAEVIVPITARVNVGKPVLFAVTIERPGGVVVSAREHIVVLAKPRRA
jgi:hypothetical protein